VRLELGWGLSFGVVGCLENWTKLDRFWTVVSVLRKFKCLLCLLLYMFIVPEACFAHIGFSVPIFSMFSLFLLDFLVFLALVGLANVLILEREGVERKRWMGQKEAALERKKRKARSD
jgi:hypothetical protein